MKFIKVVNRTLGSDVGRSDNEARDTIKNEMNYDVRNGVSCNHEMNYDVGSGFRRKNEMNYNIGSLLGTKMI